MDNKLVNPQKTIETIQKYQFAFQKRFSWSTRFSLA